MNLDKYRFSCMPFCFDVADGEDATAANFNSSFMSRESDTSTTGKVDLNDTGSTVIVDVQAIINSNITQIATNVADILINAGLISTNTGNIASNTTESSNIRTTQGTSNSDTDMGAFTGAILTDNSDVKALIQELSDALEPLTDALDFQGLWNADTNTPTLTSSAGTKGHFYIVSVSGTTSLDGISDWFVGDWAVFDGSVWRKVDNTDSVNSVFGRTGVVTAQTNDYTWAQIDKTTAPIDDLSDVDTSSVAPVDTDVLTWVSANSKWEPKVPTGGGGAAVDSSNLLRNIGVTGSAISNALNVTMTRKDGVSSAGAAPNDIEIGMRRRSNSNGGYELVNYITNTTLSIPQGATLGYVVGDPAVVYVYALYDGTNKEIAVSSILQDETDLHSTTALSAASDDSGLYSTSVRSSAAIRLVGKIRTTPIVVLGDWTAAAQETVYQGQDSFFQEELITFGSSTYAAFGSGSGAFIDIGSAVLRPGTWNLTANINTRNNGGITNGSFQLAISEFSANTTTDHTNGENLNITSQVTTVSGFTAHLNIPHYRVVLTETKTIYLKVMKPTSSTNFERVHYFAAERVKDA